MDILTLIWRYGAPVLFGLAIFVVSLRHDPDERPVKRSEWWLLALLLMMTGDAAVGESRPPAERVVKAVGAGLAWVGLVIACGRHWWRRREQAAARVDGG